MALALLKPPSGSSVLADGNLLKRAEWIALRDGAHLATELTKDMEDAKKKMLDKLAEVADQQRQKVADLARQTLVQEIHALRQRAVVFENQLVDRFAETIVECLRRLVNANLSDQFLFSAVKTAIEASGFFSEAKLIVCPSDLRAAQVSIDKLRVEYGDLRVAVDTDVGLPRGTCWFITEAGKIDASLNTQLSMIRQTLEALAAAWRSDHPQAA